ncbi:MAG: hypothetical protein WC860_07385 [Candidatus Margulisiibacteriota bacterium]
MDNHISDSDKIDIFKTVNLKMQEKMSVKNIYEHQGLLKCIVENRNVTGYQVRYNDVIWVVASDKSQNNIRTIIITRNNTDTCTLTIKNSCVEINNEIIRNPDTTILISKIIYDAKTLLNQLFKPNDTIITLNYDVLTEHIICLLANESTNNKIFFNYGKITGIDGSTSRNKNGIEILKPHGSFNFFPYKLISSGKRSNSLDALINTKHDLFIDSQYFNNNDLFPGIGSNSHKTDKEYLPEIVLPTFVKSINTITQANVWKESILALQDATEIIIIGLSLRLEDNLILLSLFMGRNEEKSKIYRILNGSNNLDNLPFRLENIKNIHFYIPDDKQKYNKAYKDLINDLNLNE